MYEEVTSGYGVGCDPNLTDLRDKLQPIVTDESYFNLAVIR